MSEIVVVSQFEVKQGPFTYRFTKAPGAARPRWWVGYQGENVEPSGEDAERILSGLIAPHD